MARRSEHSQEEIKEMVLQAAETIVNEEGFHSLKVRKVAMEIGYTVGSIYMVFENMADLILHVKGRTLDELADYLEAIVAENAEPEQCILALSKGYLTFANEHYNRWRMIFEVKQPEDEELPLWYQAKVNRIFAGVEQLFDQLKPGQTNQQNKLKARALWGGVHGICMLSLDGKLGIVGVDDIEELVVVLVRNFIAGCYR